MTDSDPDPEIQVKEYFNPHIIHKWYYDAWFNCCYCNSPA